MKQRLMPKIGDTIQILKLYGEENKNYEGKMGVVKGFDTDFEGRQRMLGSWGGIAIYLNEDSWTIVK